jgi:sarcosine oxidase, subunit gamma
VIDLTHGRALIRLNGPFAADVPGKVCATGTSDGTTPDGAASRASAAAVATGVLCDDAAGLRS